MRLYLLGFDKLAALHAIALLWLRLTGVHGVRLTSSIHAVTPFRTATTRRFGIGDDTITSVHLGTHHGEVVFFEIAHHGKMHQNKKSGGRTYHRHIDVRGEIPDGLDHLVLTCVLFNMADPNASEMLQVARDMAVGVSSRLSHGTDLVDDLKLNPPNIALPFVHVDVQSMIQRLQNQFRNADGPVWFSSMAVANPGSVTPGRVWDGSRTEAGLTGPAVYEVDWKVRRD